MNKNDITSKDMNLLVIFESLFRSGNVSQSAKELSLSQSAVSHALSRLRDMFGDPLFP
jgi:DNA-binding transcriptional LysR family regulator